MLFPILELSCSELIQGVAIVQCNPTHRLCYLHCRFWNDSSCENPSMFLFDCLFSFWHILFMFHVWLGQFGLDFSLTLTLCLCLGELRHKMYFVFLCKTCSCTQRREGFIRNKLLFFFFHAEKILENWVASEAWGLNAKTTGTGYRYKPLPVHTVIRLATDKKWTNK